jgi:hypothetical protein
MALSLQVAMKVRESEVGSLESKMRELDQLVRRNPESSVIQTRMMLAMVQGKIVMCRPIDLSLFSEEVRYYKPP